MCLAQTVRIGDETLHHLRASAVLPPTGAPSCGWSIRIDQRRKKDSVNYSTPQRRVIKSGATSRVVLVLGGS